MKRCRCGELVESYARFHYARPHEENVGTEAAGHYVHGPSLQEEHTDTFDGSVWTRELPPRRDRKPYNLRLLADLWGGAPQLAPSPGAAPPDPKLWDPESTVRRLSIDFMESFGYSVADLEQGYRGDGSTRVQTGIGDAYFHGHDLRGWIEFKRWDNRPSADQIAFARRELDAGGIYLLIYEPGQLLAWHQAVRTHQGGS